jgi:hypothetical protein
MDRESKKAATFLVEGPEQRKESKLAARVRDTAAGFALQMVLDGMSRGPVHALRSGERVDRTTRERG